MSPSLGFGTANKAWACFISVLLVRLIMRWTGIDLAALGVDAQFQWLVQISIDGVVAFISSQFVYWVPNIKRLLHLDEVKVDQNLDTGDVAVTVQTSQPTPSPTVVSPTGDSTTTVIFDPGPTPPASPLGHWSKDNRETD